MKANGDDILRLKQYLRKRLLSLGFSRVGFASTGQVRREIQQYCQEWLLKGYNGQMKWLRMSMPLRLDARRFYPEVKTIVSLSLPWGKPGILPGFIAGYAWLKDYHAVIRERIKSLGQELKDTFPEVRFRYCVDTGPVLEKYWAVESGLGWMGKNTLLITPGYGSWVMLATLMLNIALSPDRRLKSRCGDCTRCLEACPTGALKGPYILDANRCIAYLTVEYQSSFSPKEEVLLNGSVFGCDRCQVVCPYNQNGAPEVTTDSEVEQITAGLLKKFSTLDRKEFNQLFALTPVRRIGWEKFQRQVELALAYFKKTEKL
ncbi:MAG: tRNA epoxyqueuosine(34) reductase QueG [Candidatus Omnitrophica bacterium]|nr:tRNA epoxyqueuosine(34) reductase QueG [Candidatus Omnitrophota bacterium]MCM8769712.1 tRNA epoxyqueuosine(34) reductase QueG [Candidatus Omnitrophota bacterium]